MDDKPISQTQSEGPVAYRQTKARAMVIGRTHTASATCWCEPILNYVDPETGHRLYVHRDIN